jgi:hypothetical protein
LTCAAASRCALRRSGCAAAARCRSSRQFFLAAAAAATAPLSPLPQVKSADDKTGRPHCFEVATADETFFMCADSDAAKDEWVGQLGRAIVVASRSYNARGGADEDDDDDDDDD